MVRMQNPDPHTVIVECTTAKLPEVLKALRDAGVTLVREPFLVTTRTYMFEVLVDDRTVRWIASLDGVCGAIRQPVAANC